MFIGTKKKKQITTDINSWTYNKTHHVDLYPTEIQRKGHRRSHEGGSFFPNWEPGFLNGGPCFLNGGPGFLIGGPAPPNG